MLPFVTAELKMDVLREREVKDSLERQLLDEQKIRGKRSFVFLNKCPDNIVVPGTEACIVRSL